MTMDIELPNSFTHELKDLLESLLHRNVEDRLGCKGKGADEVKEHPFFRDLDWQLVYLQKYPPPLIPPRGEVNAADAFDIGSFDEEDTKGIKLTEADQDLYKSFPVVISERWQMEISETVFETINQETDKVELKKKKKNFHLYQIENEKESDCILHGYLKKLGYQISINPWQTRYAKLYPNRLELHNDSASGKPEVSLFSHFTFHISVSMFLGNVSSHFLSLLVMFFRFTRLERERKFKVHIIFMNHVISRETF